jgi:hypothetical protein
MSIVLLGATSGSVTLQEPAVAGTTVIDLPATSGTMAVTSGSPSFTNITATGTIKGASTISVGNATPSASGAGITFPATQSASTDANTLDDYEEGTWTPNQGTGLTVIGTYTPSGKYTKIGRSVTVIAYIAATTSVAFNNNTQLCSNLPFTPSAGENAGILINDPRSATQGISAIGSGAVQSSATQAATTGVSFTITYFV